MSRPSWLLRLSPLLGCFALGLPAIAGAQAPPPSAAIEAGEAQPIESSWRIPADDSTASDADALVLGVDDAVRRALATNEAVLLARTETERLEAELRQVIAAALPQLSADADYTNNIEKPVIFFDTDDGVERITLGSDYDVDAGLMLKQKVLDLRFGAARRAASLLRDAAEASVEDVRVAIAFAARLAYYDALLARELAGVQRQALEQAGRRLTQVEEFFNAGTAAEFDLLTAQVEVDNIRPELIQAENALAVALERLRRVTGIEAGVPLDLVDDFPRGFDAPPIEQALEAALAERSDLAALRLAAEAAEERLTIAERSTFPRLDLESGLRRRASSADVFPGDDEFSTSWTATLGFTWPIFEGGARAGRVAAAEAVLRSEQLALEQRLEDARLEVRQAVLALGAAEQAVEASKANVRRAERALDIAGVRYRNGLSTQVELNDAELAVTRARSNAARALYDAATAHAELLVATGRVERAVP